MCSPSRSRPTDVVRHGRQHVTWTWREIAFADRDDFNQMLTVSETVAHLNVLVARGQAVAARQDGTNRYTAGQRSAGSRRGGPGRSW